MTNRRLNQIKDIGRAKSDLRAKKKFLDDDYISKMLIRWLTLECLHKNEGIKLNFSSVKTTTKT